MKLIKINHAHPTNFVVHEDYFDSESTEHEDIAQLEDEQSYHNEDNLTLLDMEFDSLCPVHLELLLNQISGWKENGISSQFIRTQIDHDAGLDLHIEAHFTPEGYRIDNVILRVWMDGSLQDVQSYDLIHGIPYIDLIIDHIIESFLNL